MSNCCVCGRALKSGTIGPKCAKKALSGNFPKEVKEQAQNYIENSKKEVKNLKSLAKDFNRKYKNNFKLNLDNIGIKDEELFQEVPSVLDKLFEKIDFNFKKPPLIKAYNEPREGEDKGALALYDKDSNTIELYTSNINSPSEMALTLVHELTHRLDDEYSQGFGLEGTLDESQSYIYKIKTSTSLFDDDFDDLFAGDFVESKESLIARERKRKSYLKKLSKCKKTKNINSQLKEAGEALTASYMNFKPVQYHNDPMYIARPREVLAHSMEVYLSSSQGKAFPSELMMQRHYVNGKEVLIDRAEMIAGIKDLSQKFENYITLLELRNKLINRR